MIKFKERSYSWSDVAKSTAIGASLAVGLNKIGNAALRSGKTSAMESFSGAMSSGAAKSSGFLGKFGTIGEKLAKANNYIWDRLGKVGRYILENPAKAAVAGALIGASLALAYWLAKSAYKKSEKINATQNNDLLASVARSLIASGYKINKEFTTDPAEADYMRTKVCLVISQSDSSVSINVNSISDPKLDDISKRIIKNLPSGSKFVAKESDRNNDLMITLVDSSNNDAVYIASIAERFIRAKYPVFIVELN